MPQTATANRIAWSASQIERAVTGYLAMWRLDLRGESVVKVDFYRAIAADIDRTPKSIERKFQNISAVLEYLGMPWVQGLAPLRNYQTTLIAAVAAQLPSIWNLDEALAGCNADQVAEEPVLWSEAAPVIDPSAATLTPDLQRLVRMFDPALRDLRNRKTGYLGEKLVYRSEIARLKAADRADLARQVKWVSQEEGDGAGYDIRSFEPDGTERFFEVKSTFGHQRTPFYLTAHEREFAEQAPLQFRIFRLYGLGRDPRSFQIAPPLTSALILEPSVYRASFGPRPGL